MCMHTLSQINKYIFLKIIINKYFEVWLITTGMNQKEQTNKCGPHTRASPHVHYPSNHFPPGKRHFGHIQQCHSFSVPWNSWIPVTLFMFIQLATPRANIYSYVWLNIITIIKTSKTLFPGKSNLFLILFIPLLMFVSNLTPFQARDHVFIQLYSSPPPRSLSNIWHIRSTK